MNAQLYHLTRLESLTGNLFIDGKYTEAIELGKELLETAKKTEDIKATMNAHLNLACCYYYLGEIEIAFQHILDYKVLCDEFGDDRDKYYLYYLSALIYAYEENFEEAKDAMKQCIRIAQELEMFYSISSSFNSYSNYLLHEGNYEKALHYALKALAIAKEHCPSEILLQCHIYLSIASSYIGLNKLSKAEKIINRLELNQYINNLPHEKAHFLHVKATFHRSKGEYDIALQLLHKSFNIYSEYNNQMKLKSILKVIAEIYESLGNYKKSYEAMKEYLTIVEKLFSTRLSSKIRELDVNQRIKALEKRANVDSLTGVYNRYYIETTCDKWLKEMKKTDEHICCVVIDIDSFKNINDTFGHLIGDEVIKGVAQACLKVANEDKENIIVGRYGGDEFIVLLKGYPSHSIMERAKQLYNEITSFQINYLTNEIKVTVSIGVVCTNSLPYAKKFTQIFKVADQALYMAKRQGKNQIVYLSNENC